MILFTENVTDGYRMPVIGVDHSLVGKKNIIAGILSYNDLKYLDERDDEGDSFGYMFVRFFFCILPCKTRNTSESSWVTTPTTYRRHTSLKKAFFTLFTNQRQRTNFELEKLSVREHLSHFSNSLKNLRTFQQQFIAKIPHIFRNWKKTWN